MTRAADWLAPVVLLAVILMMAVEAWGAPSSEGATPQLGGTGVAPSGDSGTVVALPDPSVQSEITAGEWRCVTRPEWERRVLAPLRDLEQCRAVVESEQARAAAYRQAALEADQAAREAEERADRMRRQRWLYVGAGALAGGALVAGTVWAGVQVVGAR